MLQLFAGRIVFTSANNPDVRAEFGCSTTAVGDVRNALSAYLAHDSLIDDVVLAASELVTNVVRHTGTGGVSMYDGPTLRVEVHDPDRTPPSLQPQRGVHGGFGLRIVDSLADAWGSFPTPTGKVVWAAFVRQS